MNVSIAELRVEGMNFEVRIEDSRVSAGGSVQHLCRPLKGFGSAWVDRTKLTNVREIIKPWPTSSSSAPPPACSSSSSPASSSSWSARIGSTRRFPWLVLLLLWYLVTVLTFPLWALTTMTFSAIGRIELAEGLLCRWWNWGAEAERRARG